MGLFNRNKADKLTKDYTFTGYPHLLAIKPKEKYIFHSDYFEIDNQFACIMSFFHTETARDDFGPFWGINKIPGGLDNDITVVVLEQVRRMTEGWLRQHQNRSETVSKMSSQEQDRAGSMTSKGKAYRKEDDLQIIAQELQDGAAYLNVHYRLLVKAPTLEKLDEARTIIDRLYIDRFATLNAAPYLGEQRGELSSLFARNERKIGKGFYFTSTEFAGSHSLVTHGLEDAAGEYVGYMVGDVNNSAVLFDVNGYNHHIVVTNENFNDRLGRVYVADMWGSKISQACMMNNGRVVHIILDDCDLDKLGPKFEKSTYRIDMNSGDVNMFEMFGDVDDELNIFPMQMEKLILMAEQAYETTDQDRSVIRGSLEDVATKFYIDNRMWRENAAHNRNKLRVTSIPHNQVPKLEMFCSYLDTEYKILVNSSAKDPERLHAMSILAVTFKNLLSVNGDLFNTITTNKIDGAKLGRRVIYDFSSVMHRGKGVAMAQLVNIVGFAVGNLDRNDTVIIHGAENIDQNVRDYINQQFERLWAKGGRVCYLYNSTDKALDDVSFNHFDKADYTVFGTMTENTAKRYQEVLGQEIPADLENLITKKNPFTCYIRRDFDNVVFHQDLLLGLSGKGVLKNGK